MRFAVLMSCYVGDDPQQFQDAGSSILIQTRPPDEIVLVCDGPITTELERSVDCFVSQCKVENVQIKLVRLPENVGLGSALAIGAQRCESTYIVRMDSDDISTPERLQQLEDGLALLGYPDVLGAQIEEFNQAIGDLSRKRIVPQDHSGIVRLSALRSPMNHVTVCLRKEALDMVGGYEDVRGHEDYFLWLKLINSGAKFANLPDVHVYVRVASLTSRRSGLQYLLSEYNFAKKCATTGQVSFFWALRFLLTRSIIRLAPVWVVQLVYSKLRS